MRFLKVIGFLIFGLLAVAILMAVFGPETTYFEVRRVDFAVRDDGASLDIVNTGRSSITIQAMIINERPDCTVGFLIPVTGTFPYALKVGDKFSIYGTCRVIRAEIVTNLGRFAYAFDSIK